MKELIKIQENENLGQAVSARELYQFLEGKEQFTDWIKRMFEYGFEEGVDFVGFSEKYEKPQGGRPSMNYAITLDTAKEIAMIQKSPKGKQARQYFIQCERIAKSVQNGIGIEYRDGKLVLPTSSISSTTGILHDELMRLIKKYLDEHTEVSGGIRKPLKDHLKKGKFLIENVWELNIFNNKGIPHKEYILTRDGFNYLVKWHGFLAFSGFLPNYSREFEIDAHQEHIKSLE